jgi:hypothetical protein
LPDADDCWKLEGELALSAASGRPRPCLKLPLASDTVRAA